jgi:hypothetical protein
MLQSASARGPDGVLAYPARCDESGTLVYPRASPRRVNHASCQAPLTRDAHSSTYHIHMGAPAQQAIDDVARSLAAAYAALPEVRAVAMAGSWAGDVADDASDLDLYVYYTTEIPLAPRSAVAAARGVAPDLDNRAFEPGDSWEEAASGLPVDVTFRHTTWTADILARTLEQHEASLGYSTCIWANVLASRILFDRGGWLASLQERACVPYPEPLRRAIIAKNHPLLRRARFSFLRQLDKAVARADWVSVNHRIAAMLASYFDVLFALNRVPHPGEKRLVALAVARCGVLPEGMTEGIAALCAAGTASMTSVVEAADRLVDGLDRLLVAEHLISP